jgi:1-acyl-sn-glycerol-3-phosphate acyltransferase
MKKLDIPQNGFVPTNQNRKTWLVSPFGTNIDAFAVWIPFAAFFPALLVFIVLFFEVELTGLENIF